MPEIVQVETLEGIATVTIDRPEALNAINRSVLAALEAAFTRLAADPSLRAVILTGAGKAFVAGADIKEMADFGPEQARELSLAGHAVMKLIEDFPRPVIAAVNGFALGGGCELALACDVRISSEKAKLGLPEVTLGVIPGFGGTQRLARLVGRSAAKLLLFTGEVLPAAKALALGLVEEVVPPEALMPRCQEIAKAIAAKGPVAVSLAKRAVNEGADADLDEALSGEVELFAQVFGTADQKEGMRAFVEKRPPQFVGG
ncbi:MAG: enoyl-CoA hydratase-related protein [Myxococcales bacterium]